MSARLFSPRGVLWRVDREMILLLGGGRALLMQLAHPKIATGVAEHSRFRRDPLVRLYQTMNTMWSIVFDEEAKARQSLGRLERIHRSVRGTVGSGGSLPAGTFYTAEDPELQLWVHATLVDSAIVAYERFVAPLSASDKRAYYRETVQLGALFGLAESALPGSFDAFAEYMATMMASEAITVGATARLLASDILHPRPLVLRIGGPLTCFVTAGLLPADIREGYGLHWSGKKETCLNFLGRSIRILVPLLPDAIRVVPQARAAESASRRLLGPEAEAWHWGRPGTDGGQNRQESIGATGDRGREI